MTNRIAGTAVEVAELIDWYWARWKIGMLFNVFKTGCKVEELQLGTIESIERALIVYLIVAWRISCLVRMGRTCPDLEARLFFDPDETRSAFLLNKLRPPPNPTLDEVLRMIARVGEFLGRKGDGEPGAQTLWEGLRDVRASALTPQALRELDD